MYDPEIAHIFGMWTAFFPPTHSTHQVSKFDTRTVTEKLCQPADLQIRTQLVAEQRLSGKKLYPATHIVYMCVCSSTWLYQCPFVWEWKAIWQMSNKIIICIYLSICTCICILMDLRVCLRNMYVCINKCKINSKICVQYTQTDTHTHTSRHSHTYSGCPNRDLEAQWQGGRWWPSTATSNVFPWTHPLQKLSDIPWQKFCQPFALSVCRIYRREVLLLSLDADSGCGTGQQVVKCQNVFSSFVSQRPNCIYDDPAPPSATALLSKRLTGCYLAFFAFVLLCSCCCFCYFDWHCWNEKPYYKCRWLAGWQVETVSEMLLSRKWNHSSREKKKWPMFWFFAFLSPR